jgi:hypothetical protein
LTASTHLVDDTVSSTATIPPVSTTLCGDRVQFVEEKDTRSGGPSLVEDFADIRLGLSEPHGEKLRTLDGDEVGLALVCNRLCQERLTASRWSVEKDTP